MQTKNNLLIGFLSSTLLIFMLVGCQTTGERLVKSTSGAMITAKDLPDNEFSNSHTNIPLFLSQIDKFEVKRRNFSRGNVVQDRFIKSGPYGGKQGTVTTNRAVIAWFGVSTWQAAKEIEDFKAKMRQQSSQSFSSGDIIKHKQGPDDFGFSAIKGDCIYARWAFNLRGAPSYDNDNGYPDTTVYINGCNLLNDHPNNIFKKIEEMDSESLAKLSAIITGEIKQENKANSSVNKRKKEGKNDKPISSNSKEAKLKEAKELFSKGLIEKNEYDKLKKQILGLN